LAWFALLLSCATPTAFADVRERHGDRWVEIAPPARAEQVSIYDEQHRLLIVFGGQVDGVPRNDVWVLSLSARPHWDRIEPTGEVPSPRAGAAAAYDAARDRLLLFGGRDTSNQPLDDLWELSLHGRHGRVTWRLVTVASPRPAGRYRATLTPDPENGGFVLYGGERGYGGKLADVWKLSLSRSGPDWRPVTPSGTPPTARSAHSAAYCPDLRGILVFGGELYVPSVPGCPVCFQNLETAEIWLLTLGDHPAWTSLRATSIQGPCEMQGHAAAWDEAGHRMLVFGGGNFWRRACPVSDAAAWSLSVPGLAWSQLAPAKPWPRLRPFASAFFDPTTRSLYVHGGESSVSGGACYFDAWRLGLDPEPAWTLLHPVQVTPQLLAGSQRPAVYDPRRDRIVVDGGDQVWGYDIESAGWSPIIVSGAAPPVHTSSSAVLDTRRDRLVVYGGLLSDQIHPFREVWALSLGDVPEWTQLPTDGPPPAASFASAIYDPIRDRLLVYAASSGVFRARGVWALPFGTTGPPEWQQISSPSDTVHVRTPTTRAAVVAYDSRRDRMVVFAGGYYDPTEIGLDPVNGCWALALDGRPIWDVLSPEQFYSNRDPAHPMPRVYASGIYDAAGDRLVVVGGFADIFAFHIPDDSWAMTFDSNGWTQLRVETDPHPGWLGATAVYDSRRSRTLVLQGDIIWALESGRDGRRCRPHAVALESQGPTPGPSVLDLRGACPNPSVGEMTVQLTLPDAAPATLELLDLAGRRVWSQDVGRLGGGPHVIRVSAERDVGPGLYMLRLTHGSASFTRKVVRLGE